MDTFFFFFLNSMRNIVKLYRRRVRQAISQEREDRRVGTDDKSQITRTRWDRRQIALGVMSTQRVII